MKNNNFNYSNTVINNWFITQSIDHSVRTIVFSIIFTLILSSGLQFLSVDDDMMKMLPKNMDSKITWDALQEEFGSTEVIFVAFGKEDSSILNPNTLSDLWLFSERLDQLNIVDNVINISRSMRIDNIDGFMEIGDLQSEQNLDAKSVRKIKVYLDKNANVKKQLMSQNGDFLLTIIQPYEGIGLDEFRDKIVSVSEPLFKEYEVFFGGTAYITGSLPKLIREDIRLLILSGMVIMVIILLINLRSIRGVLMVLMVIIFSLLVMMGSMGWLYKFTESDRFLFAILSTSMPIILLTIANSDGVHVVTKFFREMRFEKNKRIAISRSMNSLLLPIFLTSFTTIAAFLTMTTSPLEPLIGYGICISIGILWAWFLSSLMLPSVINLQKWDYNSSAIAKESYFERLIKQLGVILIRYPQKVFLFGLVFVFLGLTGIYKVGVDVNVASFFKPGSELRNSMDFMDNEMTGTMDLRIRVEGDMKDPELLHQMDDLQHYLKKENKISLVYSITDIVKQMHRTIMDDKLQYEVIPKKREKVNNLFTMYSMSGDPEDFSSIIDYDYKVGLITALSRVMTTEEVFLFINRVNSYIDEAINDTLKINITGFIIVVRDMVIMIIKSSLFSIFFSLFIVGLISSIFFKRGIWGLLSILPLGFAIILNFGLMGHFNAKLNHITAILSSIIIGVGVDFAIHFISQFRHFSLTTSKTKISQKVINDVGYPIILDAGSNMGFGALLFSAFIPVQYIGGLMVFAMISTSLGTLTLLSASIELLKNKLIEEDIS
tara:strand:+ start:871 stop:3192 length:2322 start_codon:yes stop_codon:yes gene_type:complete